MAAAPQRIAISGASGFIGTALTARLAAGGYSVRRLVRRPPSGADEVAWDPERGALPAEALAGVEAVVHLAGANIAAGRWTAARKAEIRNSRVQSTLLLARTLAKLEPRPAVLVSASAVGYYGNRGNEVLTEESAGGSGFLADTCKAWEATTDAARQAGVRVVNLRIGVVLSARGGMLARLLPLYRYGLGGRIGNGRQYMSWIALPDLLAAIGYVLADARLSGPVNAVAPQPVTNAEFTRALARVLRRPAFLRVPAFAVKVLMGEMGRELLLSGARVLPARLDATPFRFAYRELADCLRAELTPRGL
ncbi:MAG: TIGR01777 family oxidoreductase [Planctomycetota bacterium]